VRVKVALLVNVPAVPVTVTVVVCEVSAATVGALTPQPVSIIKPQRAIAENITSPRTLRRIFQLPHRMNNIAANCGTYVRGLL
jgi:hypothetical protein